jgi:hypothetical protein
MYDLNTYKQICGKFEVLDNKIFLLMQYLKNNILTTNVVHICLWVLVCTQFSQLNHFKK